MKIHVTAIGLLSLVLTTGSGWAQQVASTNEKPVLAIAMIYPTQDQTVSGTVTFEQIGDQVRVVANLKGLSPNTKHGFHIHEYGDCSAADATSAGDHYNPEGAPHGAPTDPERHAGDLGNIDADEMGNAHHEITVSFITIDGDKNPVLGKAVVIHTKADDLKSQPTGDAGGRIGCGVIGIANPQSLSKAGALAKGGN
jgi:Cu-Zn family superoxide dismutase